MLEVLVDFDSSIYQRDHPSTRGMCHQLLPECRESRC